VEIRLVLALPLEFTAKIAPYKRADIGRCLIGLPFRYPLIQHNLYLSFPDVVLCRESRVMTSFRFMTG
jgi:hypothetical protein